MKGKPQRFGGGGSRRVSGQRSSGPQRSRPQRRQGPNEPNNKNLRVVVGIHSGEEALKVRPQAVKEIWLQESWESSRQLQPFAEFSQKSRCPLKSVHVKKLEEFSRGHQGVALFLDGQPEFTWDIFNTPEPQCAVLLDGIEDPQNLGAMLRTSWLMGVAAVFTPKDRAVGLTPTVCKVASGGAEHVPIEATTDFLGVMKKLKDLGFWIYALDEDQAQNIYQQKLPEKVAWIVGAEDKGVRKALLKEADATVAIPQVASGSSYNATVALAIALSETARAKSS